jgi:protein transport protein SEC20
MGMRLWRLLGALIYRGTLLNINVVNHHPYHKFTSAVLNMTSHSSLPGRLSNLSETHRVTISLINRLSRLSTHPGSSSLAGDGADAPLELTAEIHQGLKEQEDALELLRQEVDDHVAGARGAEKERERARLEASVARIGEDLKL